MPSISTPLRTHGRRIVIGAIILSALGTGEWLWAKRLAAVPPLPSSISPYDGESPEMVQAVWFRTQPQLSLLTKTGSHHVTSGAAEAAGLNPGQLEAVQQAVDCEVQRIERWVVDHAEFDSSASDPARGVWVYNLKAMEDRGESFAGLLKADLVEAAGPFQAGILFASMNRSQDYGGYGRYDVKITFSKGRGGSIVSESTYSEPGSGKVALRAGAVLDSFKQWWGNSFDSKLPP